jgi:chemosensory pili system protein ChpA (sensor histidine kinase/response regulator)
MADLQDSIFFFFVEEAAEHLSVLEAGLLEIEKSSQHDADAMEPLFRAAHTLKGAANLVKLTSVGQIAHEMEDLFELLRDGKLYVSVDLTNALLRALDSIKDLIRYKTDGEPEPGGLVAGALAAMSAAREKAPTEAPVATETGEVVSVEDESQLPGFVGTERRGPGRRVEEVAAGLRVGADKIEALMALIGEVTVIKNHLVDQVRQVDDMREEIDFIGQRLLREVTQFADRYDYTMPTNTELQNQSQISDFNELEFDRYDDLNLFSRKLREITNDIGEGLHGLSHFFNAFGRDISTLDRMTDDIKERISEVRTVPASTLFQRFNRSVRDMAQDLGLDVDLFVLGGETLLDRVVYDGLFDPLLHIIRNSFAHGIEPAAERVALGKPEKAKIKLMAERRGNTVEITVSDDGRGINLEQVRKRAIEKKFMRETDQLSERELIQMIFRPGFSTTVQADSTSGRGVGMNVVMDRLAALNGTIDVETVKGHGSTFRLRLPLSLVIINVIRFEVAGQIFVIPSALVNEIQDLAYERKRRAKADVADDALMPVDLGQLFELPERQEPKHGILTQSEGTPILMLVNQVLGQEDTVIRPFGSFLQQLPYFSGTSLAGDGSMRLVVNPARMKYHEEIQSQREPARIDVVAKEDSGAPRILIVDDSLSVRKFASLLLQANGLQVLTAADGQEALKVLATQQVDSVITDLEMPNMHGYELLAELGRRAEWTVPVAVLSSRAGEQHQEKAFKLGATDYLVKPFEEESLMAVVNHHLQMRGKSL